MNHRVVNTTILINVSCALILEKLPFKYCKLNTSRFDSLIVKRKGYTSLIYRSGKIVLVGCKGISTGRRSAERLVKTIVKFGFPAKLISFEVKNLVVRLSFSPLNFAKLAKEKIADYEPELYPAIFIKLRNKKNLTLFGNGKSFITGLRSNKEANQASKEAFELLTPFFK